MAAPTETASSTRTATSVNNTGEDTTKKTDCPSTNTPDPQQQQVDLEKGSNPQIRHEDVLDPDLVTWAGPDDAENPQNWSAGVKWRYTCAVAMFVLMAPTSSAIIAPALGPLGEDLGMHSRAEEFLSLGIFILGYAVGPVFFGPASEMYGRVRVLQASNAWYVAWNLGCAFATTKAQFLPFRFLAGVGGSAPLAVGGGAISDVWSREQRGKAMAVYTLGPLLGPVVGPIAGGFIAEYSTWRWVFWSTTIVAAVVQVVGFFWLRESHPATLLRRKCARLTRETGNDKLHTAEDAVAETLAVKVGRAVQRPVRLFATQPIVTYVSVYQGYLYGVIYLMVASFPDVWTGVYGEAEDVGGLNYLSIAIGSFVGVLISMTLVDRIYSALKARHGGVGLPEFRVPCMAMGAVLATAGLFWYGWSVQARLHWAMPNAGALVYMAGTWCCQQGTQVYLIDCYQTYAASAMAACAILRSLVGFAFPLFASYLYGSLGYGWGTSVLAFVSVGIGWTAPFVFWYWGPKLRAMSKYAAG